MELQPNVTELHPGRTMIVNSLYEALNAVLEEERFEKLPVAAALGVLEMIKLNAYHEWVASQKE